MSACSFNISFTADTAVVLEKAKKTVESQGGTFNGDDQRGSFDISVMGFTVVGSYIVEGNDLAILIDEKPMMIPCSAIESFLNSKLN